MAKRMVQLTHGVVSLDIETNDSVRLDLSTKAGLRGVVLLEFHEGQWKLHVWEVDQDEPTASVLIDPRVATDGEDSNA